MADSPHRDIYAYLNSPKGAAIEARFWSMVQRGPSEACWDWQASRAPSGYGRFKIASFEARHSNRVAWTIANRREPGDLIIRHTCDRPQCCNPAHLLIGTPLDNARDKVERGRCGTSDQRGVKNGAARLTLEQIGEIVASFRRGEQNMTIATRYPVGHALVSRIRTGRSWQAEAAQFGWSPAIQYLEQREAA